MPTHHDYEATVGMVATPILIAAGALIAAPLAGLAVRLFLWTAGL